jgi:hypothetical protein
MCYSNLLDISESILIETSVQGVNFGPAERAC